MVCSYPMGSGLSRYAFSSSAGRTNSWRGTFSIEEMIAATDRGILVTRLWYNRVVDPRNTVITGMTRDGTFLIDKGKVTKGVRNFRFNESVLDVLARADMIGKDAQPTLFDYTRNCVVVPPIQVRDFNFTGVTEF